MRLGDRFQSMIAENPELKLLAQKAFVSYVRSVCLQPNKKVFQATALPLADLAESYGLSSAPRVRFLEKMQNREELKRQRMEKMEQEKALQFARNMEAAMAAASPSADSATPAPKQTLSKRVTRKNKTRERQLFAGETQVAESLTLTLTPTLTLTLTPTLTLTLTPKQTGIGETVKKGWHKQTPIGDIVKGLGGIKW